MKINNLRIGIFIFFLLQGLFFIPAIHAQTVIRGPYLQQSTPSSIIVHWRTDSACSSKVWFGFSITAMNDSLADTTKVTEHIIKISGLQHSSKYFYTIGDSSGKFLSPDSSLFFYSHPPEGSRDHYRFWVVGDAGRGNNDQRIVRDAFLYVNNGKKIDGWLWLGDNAYLNGLDSEYQANVFTNNLYENVMKHLVAWAAPGNHDYGQNVSNTNPDWLTIFDFPSNGEAGGVASGTEKYFSWNYGNIHFIQLDSYGSDRTDSGAVANWLMTDLAQNTATWTIAYWHHPPYTKGNHDSDNQFGYDPELPQIRSGIVPILENFGIDLVLNGHSHAYERSRLMDGHYGLSTTLHDSMYVDSTSGMYPASCAYMKDTLGGKGHKGTVYCVAGTSAAISGVQSTWPHPIMEVATATELGSMLLEVHENKLQARFINSGGITLDSFTIVKEMKTRKVLQACKDSALTIYPTWHEPANWSPMNAYGNSLTIFPNSDTLIIANDTISCLTDTFEIKIIPDSVCQLMSGIASEEKPMQFSAFPSPAGHENILTIKIQFQTGTKPKEISLIDITGKILVAKKINLVEGSALTETISTNGIKPGIYFVAVVSDKGRKVRKIIIQ
jgi:acid phosphatase type 7